jgi:dihydroorotate dehydrogenase (fumarate)
MLTDTSYLGLRLPHPFMAGASPFGYHLDLIKRLEDAGCAAIVLHSLFEEQIGMASEGRVAHLNPEDQRFAEVIGYFPHAADYRLGPDEYAEHLFQARKTVSIPVIGSLNGQTGQSWLRFAQAIEQAGASALELNWYTILSDPSVGAAAAEHHLKQTVRELKRILKIPVAVKLSPFYTAFANVAQGLDEAGADGLVLFNRFYQPDIDIRTTTIVPRVELSSSAELGLRLRWIGLLHGRVKASLALTGGVAEPQDGIKAVLAGADVVHLVSSLLRHGPSYLAVVLKALEDWLEWNNLTLDQARGRLSLQTTQDPAAFERAHYIRTLQSWGES